MERKNDEAKERTKDTTQQLVLQTHRVVPREFACVRRGRVGWGFGSKMRRMGCNGGELTNNACESRSTSVSWRSSKMRMRAQQRRHSLTPLVSTSARQEPVNGRQVPPVSTTRPRLRTFASDEQVEVRQSRECSSATCVHPAFVAEELRGGPLFYC